MAKIVAEPEEEKDDDYIFGQYVVSQLRQIQDPKTKLMLQKTITNPCFEARLGVFRQGSGDIANRLLPSQTFTQMMQEPLVLQHPQQPYADAYDYSVTHFTEQ